MPPGPSTNTIHQCLRELLLAAERDGESIRLLGREVLWLDDVGFGYAEILADLLELARRHAAGKRKPQSLEIRLAAPARIAGPHGGEKIDGKRLRQNGVEVSEQHGDGCSRVRQHDLPEEHDAAPFAAGRKRSPPCADVDTRLERRCDTCGDEPQPTVSRCAALLSDASQIDDRDQIARRAQRARGTEQKARLAYAHGAEHAAQTL